MGSVVSKVVNTVVDVTVGIVSGEYLAKASGEVIRSVGADVVDDMLGLDKLGGEIAQIGTDIKQIGKVLGGDYHDAMKDIENMQGVLKNRTNKYNSDLDALSERMQSLVAFHEIFKMAIANRMDKYVETYKPELDKLMEQYKNMVASLKSEYDFVIGLTEGAFFQKVVGSLIMMIGGLMSDLKDISSGEADGKTWQRAVQSVAMIIAIVYMWWNPVGWVAITAAVISSVGVLMSLDGMYANGAATGAIFGMLDFLFNDTLNLDNLIGKDFEKFDSDHKDYQEMVMFVKLGISLAAIATAWQSVGAQVSQSAGESVATSFDETFGLQTEASITDRLVNSASASEIGSSSSFMGISTSTYSDLFGAFSAANKINDLASANDSYEKLKLKLESDKVKVDEVLTSKYRKSFMKHYKDTAYFLQDQQNNIDAYIWSMTAQNMYVDPYGTTPVANIRFNPDADTRMMSFGYEEMFDESTQAGSSGYFNSIIYGS